MDARAMADLLPCREPYLELRVQFRQTTCPWLIDIDAKAPDFVNLDNPVSPHPTDALTFLCRQLNDAIGVVAVTYGLYVGSAGPHLIYRNGAIFERQSVFNRVPGVLGPTPKEDSIQWILDDLAGAKMPYQEVAPCANWMRNLQCFAPGWLGHIITYPGYPNFPPDCTDTWAHVPHVLPEPDTTLVGEPVT